VYSLILITWVPTLQAHHPSLLAYVSPRSYLALFLPRRFSAAILVLHAHPFAVACYIVFPQSVVFSLTASTSSSPRFVPLPDSHVAHSSSNTSSFSSMRFVFPRFSCFLLIRFLYVVLLLHLTVYGQTESLFRGGGVHQGVKRTIRGEGKGVKSEVRRLLVTGKGS
jgi:hypothetical protein